MNLFRRYPHRRDRRAGRHGSATARCPRGWTTGNVTVEPPRDAAHGDMATNAAMVLAKPAGLKPRDIAEVLAGHLAGDPRIASAEVAGPGFLNLRLAPQTSGAT
jgi:arginyl-tRNA synthetase